MSNDTHTVFVVEGTNQQDDDRGNYFDVSRVIGVFTDETQSVEFAEKATRDFDEVRIVEFLPSTNEPLREKTCFRPTHYMVTKRGYVPKWHKPDPEDVYSFERGY